MRRIGKQYRVSMVAGWIAGMLFALCAMRAGAQQDFSVSIDTNAAVVLAQRNIAVGSKAAWAKSTAYSAGEYFQTLENRSYLVRTAGTSGSAAPTAEGTSVTNGTLVAEFIPLGPRSGFVVINAGTNIVDLTIAGGAAGVKLWPRGSWSEAGQTCPQADIRAVTDGGAGLVTGCWW